MTRAPHGQLRRPPPRASSSAPQASILVSIALLALSTQAWGGLLDRVDTPEVQYGLCRTAADDAGQDLSKQVTVWKSCLEEMQRRGYEYLLPDIRGHLAIARANFSVSEIELSPAQRFENILVYLSAQRDARFSLEDLAKYYRGYLDTVQGRSKMEDYRDVSFRLMFEDPSDKTLLDGVFRRYLEDAGMRWAGFGTQAGAGPDVIVRGKVVVTPSTFMDEGIRKMQRVETEIQVQEIVFKNRSHEIPGFKAQAIRDDTDLAEARKSSMHEAARMCAAAMLHRIIQCAFEDPHTEPEP